MKSRFAAAAAGTDVQHKSQHSEIAAFDFKAPIQQIDAFICGQHILNHVPDACGQHIARQPDKCEDMPFQWRFDQGQARAWPVNQTHHCGGNALHIRTGKADQQVMRQGSESMH